MDSMPVVRGALSCKLDLPDPQMVHYKEVEAYKSTQLDHLVSHASPSQIQAGGWNT